MVPDQRIPGRWGRATTRFEFRWVGAVREIANSKSMRSRWLDMAERNRAPWGGAGGGEEPDTDARVASTVATYGGDMGEEITARQEQILRFIDGFLGEKGYPPSVREIGEAVGLTSSSSVHSHLSTLQKKGYLHRDPSKPRALEVSWEGSSHPRGDRAPVRNVPLLGQIAAGQPILAAEQVEEVFPLPTDIVGDATVFMLKVKGDSMMGAGILDGDYVVIRQQATADNGEIVAALVEGEEATVKRFRKTGDQVELIPENPSFDVMTFESGVQLLGKVISVIRTKVA